MAKAGAYAEPGRTENAIVRRSSALELRKQGKSYKEIGDTLGVSEATAWRDVKAALNRLLKQQDGETKVLRQMELERMNAVYEKAWTEAQNGNMFALNICVRASQRISGLLGLDMPTEINATITPGKIMDQLSDDELERIAAGRSRGATAPTPSAPEAD